MNFNNVIYKKTGSISIVTINRPDVLNSLNEATLYDIQLAVKTFTNDDEARVIIIHGAGDKAFVAGADIENMLNMNAIAGREFGILGNNTFKAIESCNKPVIAAVQGFCLGGGCELAMACDFRICSEKSKFGQPEVGLGIVPGFGGTQRLVRLVGPGMAKQLLFTGDMIDAREALRIGLVNMVTGEAELMDTVMGIAGRIASHSHTAVQFCKIAVNEGSHIDLDRALRMESDLFGLCFATEDPKHRMKEFLQKKKFRQ